ncbi:nuclear transport factor 2 family protein [Streptomyces sp. WAC 00631]|uniref:nuclear transport factor 2 family protein n=1 Tax=unclassified Streptomyces TaxID=2593676 RepID=UPI000F78CD91|nr:MULTISPECIES: nuclear transport factor 2 family protein [unclassified Streptomyces]MCC5036349.1 nuclear transport factor 2 family protein [Streptomyces sp. WAC 00631]MCC9738642.1 nuclear transport factor 2 family protein [Streptomyces sp. MNU89]
MTPPLTPADLYRHSLTLLLEKDIDGWLALCDEHIVAEFPYAPDGFPAKLEGRAALAAYMRGYPEYVDLREILRLEIHETREPGTIVAEWRGTGRMVASGAAYDMPYVAVVKVRDGRMTHYRDYWNPAAIPGSPGDAVFFPAGLGNKR